MKILRIIYLSIILGISVSCSYAQNLVPNYSFEVYDTCPNSSGQIYRATPWTDPSNSSTDYFNPCSTSDGVPNNFAGSQLAKEGNAYAGFIMFVEPSGSNYREYIQVPLTDSLESGVCYKLSFFVSVGDQNKYKVTRFGAYFSSTAVTTCYACIMPYTPQVIYFDTTGIGDTITWYKVEDTFLASGGEKFMTIGNFSSDLGTTTYIVNSGATGFAYYYIDSVSLVQVVCDTGIGVNENEGTFSFNLFPNPSNGTILLQHELKANDKAEMKIYDITGRLLKEVVLNTAVYQSEITLDLNKGIYMYQIIVNNQSVISDRLVIIK